MIKLEQCEIHLPRFFGLIEVLLDYEVRLQLQLTRWQVRIIYQLIRSILIWKQVKHGLILSNL